MLQMTGRAGRRDKPGNAVVLCSQDQAETVAELFRVADVGLLQPQLIKSESDRNNLRQPAPILSILLSEIVMQGKTTISHLNEYLSHSFSGSVIGSADCLRQVNELIRLKLVYRSEEEPEFIKPTKLGKTVSLTGLSPESGAIIAGFLRALIKLDEKYEERKGRRFGYLRRLTDLDLIFICCACYESRDAWLKTPTKRIIADVQEFLETLPPEEKPIANLWCDETSLDYACAFGCSVELYFGKDVLEVDGALKPVQWKGYDERIKRYQGEVMNKPELKNRFMAKLSKAQTNPAEMSSQDWSGIDSILSHIFEAFIPNRSVKCLSRGSFFKRLALL